MYPQDFNDPDESSSGSSVICSTEVKQTFLLTYALLFSSTVKAQEAETNKNDKSGSIRLISDRIYENNNLIDKPSWIFFIYLVSVCKVWGSIRTGIEGSNGRGRGLSGNPSTWIPFTCNCNNFKLRYTNKTFIVINFPRNSERNFTENIYFVTLNTAFLTLSTCFLFFRTASKNMMIPSGPTSDLMLNRSWDTMIIIYVTPRRDRTILKVVLAILILSLVEA